MSPVFLVPVLRDPKFMRRQAIMDDIEMRLRGDAELHLLGIGGVG
jgi:hypothetical protein